jgi:hypothetical protein
MGAPICYVILVHVFVVAMLSATPRPRGVFTSISDLKRKLMKYFRHYNKAPRTVKWKYADPSRHISTQ